MDACIDMTTLSCLSGHSVYLSCLHLHPGTHSVRQELKEVAEHLTFETLSPPEKKLPKPFRIAPTRQPSNVWWAAKAAERAVRTGCRIEKPSREVLKAPHVLVTHTVLDALSAKTAQTSTFSGDVSLPFQPSACQDTSQFPTANFPVVPNISRPSSCRLTLDAQTRPPWPGCYSAWAYPPTSL